MAQYTHWIFVKSQAGFSPSVPSVEVPETEIYSLRSSSKYMHHGDTHKAYNAYSWNTMGFILGAGTWGNVWEKQVTVRTGGHGVAYCLKMSAVMSVVRAQWIVFTIIRITLCHSVTVNWSHLQVPQCVPRVMSVRWWVSVVSGAGSVNCASVLTCEVSPKQCGSSVIKARIHSLIWVAHILGS